MKRILLIAYLSILAVPGFSQQEEGHNTLFGLYGGAGWLTKYNYDVAPSIGFEFLKEIHRRTYFGFDLFYQGYSMYYDNEANDATHGTGVAGMILRHTSSYVFIAPKFEYALGANDVVHAYVALGIGFKISGFDSLRKWDHSYNEPGVTYYDSTLDLSKNINSMILRVSFGFKEYLPLGAHWRFTFTEDFGFLPNSLTKTSDANDPARTQYGPAKMNPGCISLQIGITHSKNRPPIKKGHF